MALSAAQRTLFEKARRSGSGGQAVGLSDTATNAIVAIVARDLGLDHPLRAQEGELVPFYASDPSGLQLTSTTLPLEAFTDLIAAGPPNTDTYFACLATIHKARLKYERIVATQPVPTFEQVGPRGLLQYGTVDTGALTGLLFLRKWMFDIDNRAAQETGYLFEPIIAAAIGGVPLSAKKSPVKRSGGSGGRQVDCLLGDRAYELKLRVTIAASGQGRWGEELSFPAEAKECGYTPALLVLDSTENDKLTELTAAFEDAGGMAYVGDAAWQHLEDEAGETMSTFLEKYVRHPMQDLLAAVTDELPPMTLTLEGHVVSFKMGDHVLEIQRETGLGELDEEEEAGLPDDVDEGLPGL